MKMSNLKGRQSPALVVSLIALFVALGGGAYAAKKIKNNAISAKKLKDVSVNADKLQDNAVGTDKITDGAVTSEKVSPDIPYRHTLESTFTAGASYESLVTFGDAELQGRCEAQGANGLIHLRVISPNKGAQADMTATSPTIGDQQFANSGLLGPNVGLEITTLLLGNFNSPAVGSARVAARAPDGTALLATVGTHSLGGGACAFNALAL
jgi:hypothetical protein